MTLEQQVVSLELAKRLKELGVKQESFWYHIAGPQGVVANQLATNVLRSFYYGKKHIWVNEVGNHIEHVTYWVSAFTVAEILEGMPGHIDLEDGTRSFLVLDKYRTDTTGINYSCGYHPRDGRGFNAGFCDEKNLVEAVGLMKASLLDNELITL